jgi:tetratricopeptide (TPR) repeat protein
MIEGRSGGVKESTGAARGLLDLRFFRSLYWRGFVEGGAGRTIHARLAGSISRTVLHQKSSARVTHRGLEMRMRLTAALMAVGLAATGAACGQFAALKAKMSFKDANAAYQSGDYRKAVTKYEEAIADQKALEADPRLTAVYFYLGNSYDNLFKPARKGEPENDAYLTKAIDNYKRAAEVSQDPKLRKLALEYLVAAYRDKLDDPAEAEPVVQRIIQMEPNEPTNYFALAKLYEDAGRYEDAESMYIKARDISPNDPQVHMQLGGYYNRQGRFDEAITAFEARASKEPNNPEAYQYMAPFFWEKAFKDHTLKDPQKKEYAQRGVEVVDKALKLKPDYLEALVYKGLLLRVQANLEKDRKRQEALLAEAKVLQDRAVALRKKQQASGAAGD